ncbi:MAG: hypothetical protein F6K00_15300 [Leptolyngbya sp. SIOISBB]|nr:hypothetical protein [Leptolyngbya sp. SIOISBB]
MPSKNQLQTILKDKYGINKNITQSLTFEDCESLLLTLQSQPETAKLVESFINKNGELAQSNRSLGQRRQQAEKKFARLQVETEQLEQSIAKLEQRNNNLGDRKSQLSEEQQALESQIQALAAQNQRLNAKVSNLGDRNEELIEANDELKRDNKELKNLVDQIRLRLARDMNSLLQYEDSELRKAMIRLLRWTLG